MIKDRKLTEEQLKIVLQEKYGCKYDGKDLPPPYQSLEDMPLWFITPSGHKFSVPADDGAGYGPQTFDKIIRAAKLDVIIKLEKPLSTEQK